MGTVPIDIIADNINPRESYPLELPDSCLPAGRSPHCIRRNDNNLKNYQSAQNYDIMTFRDYGAALEIPAGSEEKIWRK